GFQTGDLVVADIPKGKYQGRWRGRVAVRKTGYFDIGDGTGKRICQGISAFPRDTVVSCRELMAGSTRGNHCLLTPVPRFLPMSKARGIRAAVR
ncbi:MAG: hypothetical protein M0Z41_07305, partial [Peptococcaceae bacterium]|nr:hypothetical protein [Peptococcaceae bacterium]